MAAVLLAVALGVLVGHLNLFPYGQKTINKLTTTCLLVMLLAMGANLGANDKLLADLTRIGWQALVLALGSVVGSVLLVRAAEKRISEQLKQDEEA
ncbi:protein of unknown function DUF340 membrane [Desulfotomaculum nigrificans CO-1-SRB]|uniref:Lysine exporter LysO family protein n=1 Tax=Desulfotomaculum nigrificans (strain DSM 14880 / VKM B-2319 / CO-1-SRB) TaxID=868595 RepID=F6B7K8_DESCC|nr:LysO family transporter [Desulfotomaculum nigrificans]AEF94562.1 protein of unknown function DUF340 membrane [Desulfotomaculum nigrificans CO-1-SRB]